MNADSIETSAPADSHTHPYSRLSPDLMLDAVESAGFSCTGGFLALNSYENRVYQVECDDHPPVVAKFYRPDRWSREVILEEHQFAEALVARDVPVVPPLSLPAGNTLGEFQGFLFSISRRQGGRRPSLENSGEFQWLGRLLGRIHALGAARPFHHRPHLNLEGFGTQPRQWLLQSRRISEDLESEYGEVSGQALIMVRNAFESVGNAPSIALHGDFHPGNILWTDAGPHLVDLDDCRNGPAVQDLWMLLSGDRQEMSLQLSDLLEGYRAFHPFPSQQLQLLEPLRTLRIIHYAAWLGRRWEDPAFPLAFPWFGNRAYWQEQIQTLREQLLRMSEPALEVY